MSLHWPTLKNPHPHADSTVARAHRLRPSSSMRKGAGRWDFVAKISRTDHSIRGTRMTIFKIGKAASCMTASDNKVIGGTTVDSASTIDCELRVDPGG